MPRPSNKAQRRLEIVQALLRVMAKCGYESASIQLIAKEAELRSGLIHYHFKTKQEIFIELIKYLDEKAQHRYCSLAEQADTPKARIEAYIDAALGMGKGADQDAVVAWVIVGSESIRQKEIQAHYQIIVAKNKRQLISLFQAYAQHSQQEYSEELLEHVTGIALAAIAGAYQLAVTTKEVMPQNYAAQILKSTIFALLEQRDTI